ncbi:MAG: protein translocase subunit SecD [Pyrinomonadaceae bacterium]
MKKNLLQRVIIIAIVTLAGLWIVIGPRHTPTLKDFTVAGIQNTLRENIRLGLDLRGGSHLVMQVQTQEYLKSLTGNNVIAIQNAAKDQGYPIKEVRPEVGNESYRVVVEASDPSKVSEIRDALPRKVDLNDWSASTSGNTITYDLNKTAQGRLSDQAVEQALRIIESRINAVGVAEPTLQTHGAQGSHQILLQMPGIQDPERVKQLLIGQSKLELVHVIDQPQRIYATEQAAVTALGGTVPQNRRIVAYSERDEPTAAAGTQPADQKDKVKQYVVIESPAVIEGSELRDARGEQGDAGGDNYQIGFHLKPSGADKFGRWTAANVGQPMGVVLNGEVKSIATIQSQITDSGRITGTFTKQSSEDLALTLRSGALPAPLVYQEERTVGPSLGADSIRSGVIASGVGLLLVVLTMIVYYRGSGVNAVIALLLNVILTIAALILFGATLTLPGIAGLLLGIGMAVDSNVLIFERIREELRTGKTVQSAVDQGFGRAFVTIIDTHVTTIISSLFLFVFGTGPIRGFAVTLVLGLLANLFSAVYVSRTIFIWELGRKGKRVESLSI